MTSTTDTTGPSRARAGRTARPTAEVAGERRVPGKALLESLRPLRERLDSPLTSYYLLLGATTALLLVGLVMVLSASMVTSLQTEGSTYAEFLKQARFAGLGIIGAVLAARIPVTAWRRFAVPVLLLSVVLQALVIFVPSLGLTVKGNRNWLKITSTLGFQPSELVKLGLVLVGALILTKKRQLVTRLAQALIPYVVPIAALAIGLVLAGHDLGTALVLMGIVSAVLYAGGVPARWFAMAAGAVALVALVLVKGSSNRMDRITNWLSGDCTDPNGVCGQSVHGLYALADGGWWGVGLGASKEKWAWLAEAQNDFIYAIIGEELGLPGTLVILVLFALFATACFRLIRRTDDQFVRLATAGVMSWILLQAMVNIGGVIGLLPVIGLPLPLVSAGGSALVVTLLAMGMLISFARHEPGASEILATRPSVVRRSLAVLPRRRGRAQR